ncbi:HWE histidine kinase domain-containing protein [Oceaniglobus ichthyenteri]|uniref:HWE histidine kinase domain-containing protein n=1 Tax=Oceaniglobus ichthyenteri TaxID=2136177 RepID=UPI000D3407AB|nr:HWE histidine kinase domain-containing protein [Oceaniglobus ichthyenteri]
MPHSTDAELRQEILNLQNRLALVAADQERDAQLAADAANRLNLFEAMLEIVPVGVVLSDQNGRIVMGNQAVETMLGHPVLRSENTQSYGEWVSYDATGRQVESHEYPLAKVINEGAARAELDVHYQRGDGSRFWLRLIGEPVLDKAGNRMGAVVALIDIDTEHRLAEQQKVLIAELNHRVKNVFSVVKSIVSRSLRKAEIPGGVRRTIDDRLDAYAKAHEKLVGSDWDHAPLGDMVRDIVVRIGGDNIRHSGPDINLPSRQALAISMALYELSSNAVKYGSLSASGGTVDLCWDCTTDADQTELYVAWVERGGPAVVIPTEKGFGSFITDVAVSMETNGKVDVSYGGDGFEWRLTMPLDG